MKHRVVVVVLGLCAGFADDARAIGQCVDHSVPESMPLHRDPLPANARLFVQGNAALDDEPPTLASVEMSGAPDGTCCEVVAFSILASAYDQLPEDAPSC